MEFAYIRGWLGVSQYDGHAERLKNEAKPMILKDDYDAENHVNPFMAAHAEVFGGSPPVDAFQVPASDADRLAAIANDMEAEADMTHDLAAARILRGAAHKVRERVRGLR